MRIALVILFSFIYYSIAAQSDLESVERVLNDYLDGTAYSKQEQITRAFHPVSNLYLTQNGNELRVLPSKDYIGFFKSENRGRFNGRVGKILSIQLHGNIAYAHAEILMPARNFCFTDLFLLKKNEGQWSIISKTADGIELDRKESDGILNEPYPVTIFSPDGTTESFLRTTTTERTIDSLVNASSKSVNCFIGIVHRERLIFRKGYGELDPVGDQEFPLDSLFYQYAGQPLASSITSEAEGVITTEVGGQQASLRRLPKKGHTVVHYHFPDWDITVISVSRTNIEQVVKSVAQLMLTTVGAAD